MLSRVMRRLPPAITRKRSSAAQNLYKRQGAGISKAQAKAAVDAAIKVMTTALVKGDKIALVGFGTLAVQEKAERKGVNPSTGAPITIPAKKVVKFKPSAELAEKVKQ